MDLKNKLIEVKDILENKNISISSEKRLGNDAGTQLKTENGCIINLFDNGNIQYQGKNKEEIQEIIENGLKESGTGTKGYQHLPSKEIFVVYGHDRTAKAQVESMLRRWELNPLIMDKLTSEGQTIIEKLERYAKNIGFGVVIATPDDEGYEAGNESEKAFRVRQNVVLEMGMLLSHLGRKKVAILLKEEGRMEKPSDIDGLIYIKWKEDIEKEAGPDLAKEMVKVGYKISVDRL